MKKISCQRHGTTVIECIVAASILLVVMSTVTTFVFRVGRIWMDISHQRIAIHELSNQLEAITLLPADQVPDALAAMTPSPGASRSLADAEFSGELLQDEIGARVRLQLSWQASRPVRPVVLTGWLNPVFSAQSPALPPSPAAETPAAETAEQPELTP